MTTSQQRAADVSAALRDEVEALNRRLIVNGAEATLRTAFGPYRVLSVSLDLWAATAPQGAEATRWNSRSFALANDATWADLLRQAGVERAELFR